MALTLPSRVSLPFKAGMIVRRLAGEAPLRHLLFQNQYE